MGALFYDGEEYDFDDRVLAHLQIAISVKLRRREDFFLTWAVPMERGSGRHAIWVDNGVPIHFFFSGSRQPMINRLWVEQMINNASSSAGLVLGDEPAPPA